MLNMKQVAGNDWTGDKTTSKPTTGLIFSVLETPLDHQSQTPNHNTIGNPETDLMALALGLGEALSHSTTPLGKINNASGQNWEAMTTKTAREHTHTYTHPRSCSRDWQCICCIICCMVQANCQSPCGNLKYLWVWDAQQQRSSWH